MKLAIFFSFFCLFIATESNAISFVNFHGSLPNLQERNIAIYHDASDGSTIYGGYSANVIGQYRYPTLSKENANGVLLWSFQYPAAQSIGATSTSMFWQIIKPSSGTGLIAVGAASNFVGGDTDVFLLHFDPSTGAVITNKMIQLVGSQDFRVRIIELSSGGFALTTTTSYNPYIYNPTATLIKLGAAPNFNVQWVKEWGVGTTTAFVPIEIPNNKIAVFGQSQANPPNPPPNGAYENYYVMIVGATTGSFVNYRSLRAEPLFRQYVETAIYDAATSAFYVIGVTTGGVPGTSPLRGSLLKLSATFSPVYYREFWQNNTNTQFYNYDIKKNAVSGKLNFVGYLYNTSTSLTYPTIGEIDPATGAVTNYNGYGTTNGSGFLYSLQVISDGSVKATGFDYYTSPSTGANNDILNIKTDTALNVPCNQTSISVVNSSVNYPVYYKDFVIPVNNVSYLEIVDPANSRLPFSLASNQACFLP